MAAEATATGAAEAPAARPKRSRKAAADAAPSADADAGTGAADAAPARAPAAERPRKGAGRAKGGRKRKGPRFETGEPELRGKKRARLEKMRRQGLFGVPGRPRKLKRKKSSRDELVRPSPPLEKTDPLKHYLAGEMVPCPVGCGGFSEVVRISTQENGNGEVWFECLSCAQRKMFEIEAASLEERASIVSDLETGREPFCPRHSKQVQLRRRGRDFVCPECGVSFPEP